MDQNFFVGKFRYNQVFYAVGADDFLKQLLNSPAAREALPLLAPLGDITDLSFKQMTCNVVNMNYFDIFEELQIVNPNTSMIQGCMDEFVNGMSLGDKLRTGLLFEDDENYPELQQDKYQNEFIFKLL